MRISNTFKYAIIAVVCSSVIYTFCIINFRDPSYKFLYGKWKVYKHTPVNGMGCLSQEEADKIIKYFMNKEVVFSKSYIIFNDQKFNKPTYQMREEKTDDYLYQYRIPDKEIFGIEQDIVKIINIKLDHQKSVEIMVDFIWSNCLNLYVDEIIYHDEELILSIDREFFHLKNMGSAHEKECKVR